MSVPDLAAVLWDMDGTLVDTEGLWSVTMAELAAHHGGELSAATREELTGSSLHRTVRAVRAEVGLDPGDADGVAADGRWLIDRTAEVFSRGVPWRPGAYEALTAVRESGLPTALVTSTYRELTDVALDTIGREFFDLTVCGDEVPATKPDPAPYRRAAELLGVDPRACVAVEDSPTGTRSAVAAGATVLVVPAEVPVPPGKRRVLRASLVGLAVADLRALLTGPTTDGSTDHRTRAAAH
ncbi:HAD family hydrolase [Actinomycetospora cinnamomea]|uniref:HAD superfamily hydrolase (TIGR01509 family)/HAD superfamily hydrolase (TIGR01549 family) n=1 Tax=Actinomycetospora cinnamomea TaxID=663609 RepID=A0A2U1EUT1_9PSEU|nr:HAD family phosphatase [Actinomycetospora cinnamomea]PVZ03685.1 HAD superfamily hydrolase (TIGR01509 family)/HAD superfamily hydrolase (TIGR01549 family) [Actinomycetospora cinnamomea]